MHLDGLDVVLKLVLHESQALLDPADPSATEEFLVNAFMVASLVLRMAKCLSLVVQLGQILKKQSLNLRI